MAESFHERLRRLREGRGITMRELAKQVAVPETTYREWERGRAIRGQPYVALALALGVSVRELLTGEATHKPDLLQALEHLEGAVRSLRTKVVEYL